MSKKQLVYMKYLLLKFTVQIEKYVVVFILKAVEVISCRIQPYDNDVVWTLKVVRYMYSV